ncbi:hypothetical protein ANO14919_041090 [Xylariales sp. No.14919]|nr:hypothetical protein ANO14919_041090 [Xylariales sp. No.14919]
MAAFADAQTSGTAPPSHQIPFPSQDAGDSDVMVIITSTVSKDFLHAKGFGAPGWSK